MPRNVVATSKERTMQTSRPYNLPKNQKANDNPKQNTFGKPPAACSNKFKSLEILLQATRKHCAQTQRSCTLQQQIVREYNLPARCTRTLFANTALLQPAQHLCRHAKAPCNRATGVCQGKSIKITNISII